VGALNGVAIDSDGESVWVANRCGGEPGCSAGSSPFLYDSCRGFKRRAGPSSSIRPAIS